MAETLEGKPQHDPSSSCTTRASDASEMWISCRLVGWGSAVSLRKLLMGSAYHLIPFSLRRYSNLDWTHTYNRTIFGCSHLGPSNGLPTIIEITVCLEQEVRSILSMGWPDMNFPPIICIGAGYFATWSPFGLNPEGFTFVLFVFEPLLVNIH